LHRDILEILLAAERIGAKGIVGMLQCKT